MNPGRQLSDSQMVIEQGPRFECHMCGEKAPVLCRARIQEWPSATVPSLPTDYERFVIRRRLICTRCFYSFVYPGRAICAFATVAGKVWCLRHRPEKRAVLYSHERWVAYVDRRRPGAQATSGMSFNAVHLLRPRRRCLGVPNS